jgi:hypothetical protein
MNTFSLPPAFSLSGVMASLGLNKLTRRGLLLVALALGFLLFAGGAFAQTTGSTSLGDTSFIDGVVCAFLKIMKRFGFYILIGSLIIISFAIKMGEGRDVAMRVIQIIAGVWLLINVVAIANGLTGGQLAQTFNCPA